MIAKSESMRNRDRYEGEFHLHIQFLCKEINTVTKHCSWIRGEVWIPVKYDWYEKESFL